MPCGGIIICTDGPGELGEKCVPPSGGCWVCGEGGCRHFLIEWDTYIHARCAVKAMNDPESEVAMVISHQHDICLDFSLEV